jgi:hypothetical protein
MKQSCNLSESEICLFKVSNSSPINPAKWRSVADSSHIADCNFANTPNTNTYPNEVCCKITEICNDGIDNDGDGYIDCADEDCKHFTTPAIPPEFCTGSPFTSDVCINVTRVQGQPPVIIVNPLCRGQIPGDPILNPENLSYYCSYGYEEDPSSGTGLCCPNGTYAKFENGEWICADAEACGLSPLPCDYDFDISNLLWRNNKYLPGNNDWCVSRMPYLWTPDEIPYAPYRSTGCCLVATHGTVGYFTQEENVKIFGYARVCGDGIVDPPLEQCDGQYNHACNTTNYKVCAQNYVISGNLSCLSNCRITNTTCSCQLPQSGGTGIE